jgi:hypothetical protein
MHGGEENLVPVRSVDEARERGRNGGKASGEARRRKKTMRQLAEALLDSKVTDEALLERFEALGFKTKGLKISQAMLIGQMLKAMEGDPRCFQAILDLVEPKTEIQPDAVEDLTPIAEMLQLDDADQ